MYRLLIVDDEPVIVDGLVQQFERSELPLELYAAYDGLEALEIASRLRMDIVLSDIEMPGLNGIGLQVKINRLWPRCKVVFLTGYNDFGYIQSSMRGGAVDYVLKTEWDEAIIEAVCKAIRELTQDMSYERLIEGARQRLLASVPMLRKEYLQELLQGEAGTADSRHARFSQLGIPLHPERSVLMAAGRVDGWPGELRPGDKALYLYSINNIVEEHLSGRAVSVHLTVRHDRLVWLMQPTASFGDAEAEAGVETEAGKNPNEPTAEAEEGRWTRFVQGTLETAQAVCREYLKLVCSFVVSSEPADWCALPAMYDRLSAVFAYGLGTTKEILLSDRYLEDKDVGRDRLALNRIHLLGTYLDDRDKSKFDELYGEVMAFADGEGWAGSGPALEVFYSLAALFIARLNRRGKFAQYAGRIDLYKLFSVHEHDGWSEADAFFRRLADLLLDADEADGERETSETVRAVNDYIEANLGGDLSLNRLADVVHLTPTYLSKLYGKSTGGSLSDYIYRERLAKAKRLLMESDLRIADVGVRVGYWTPSYFTRFFRKMTGMSPQEFRDSIRLD
ncbi:helix-turn-helix domain-containing protein [Cohnella herbarum]|uniref:Response regulator n=1 Tax=Cohnella herbarum TaxID=2728023 RepID=A0A7Z2ZKA6_9BACL|nr:helix-turn-helix domain-containing protein [Cohnella herbarum]QJD81907.1 response regulator [Cohnella herbarum]